LQDTDELLAIIRPRKQVKAYIYGHTHDWGLHRDESGIHLINLPPTAFLFTAGRPNGWVRAELKPDGVRLELRCLDQTHKEHGHQAELEYRA
jgi:Icc protein